MTNLNDPASRFGKWRFYLLLAAIIGVGALFRLYHFHLTIGNDDQRWIAAAREFGYPQSTVPRVYYSRILFSAVLHLWGEIFGFRLESTAVLMFLFSALTTLLISQSGRLLFGHLAGLIAAAFYALHPLAVVQDVMTLPDNLANVLLSACFLLFFIYLRDHKIWSLVTSAFLIGLSFSAKEYYILAALPLGACLLSKSAGAGNRFSRTAAFCTIVATGMSIDFALHFWQSGDFLAHFRPALDYSDRMTAVYGAVMHPGFQQVARECVSRLRYLDWFLFEYGVGHSFAVLCSIVFLLYCARRRLEFSALCGLLITFLGFLMFMPVKLWPLRFVEMEPRYLLILLPIVAIVVGGVFASLLSEIKDRALMQSLATALGIGFVSGIGVADDFSNPAFIRGGTQEFLGIRDVLADASKDDISQLVLARHYREIIPRESYRSYGVDFAYFEINDAKSASNACEYLQHDHRRVFFVPRSNYSWPLAHDLRRGEYDARAETQKRFTTLVEELKSKGCHRREVRVPDSVLMEWLAWFGLVNREQQLIGWVYRFDQSPKESASKNTHISNDNELLARPADQ
jgi:hypothetical protein